MLSSTSVTESFNVDTTGGSNFNTWSDPNQKVPNQGKTLVQQARVFNATIDDAERDFRVVDEVFDPTHEPKPRKVWDVQDGQLAFCRLGRPQVNTYANGCSPLHADSTRQALVPAWTSFDGINVDNGTSESIRNGIAFLGLTRFDNRVDAHGIFSVMSSGVSSVKYCGRKPVYAGQMLTYTFADDKDFESLVDQSLIAHERSQRSLAYVVATPPREYRYTMQMVGNRLKDKQFIADNNLIGKASGKFDKQSASCPIADRYAANEYAHCLSSLIQGMAALAAVGKGVYVPTPGPAAAKSLIDFVAALSKDGANADALTGKVAELVAAFKPKVKDPTKPDEAPKPEEKKLDPKWLANTANEVAKAVGFRNSQEEPADTHLHSAFVSLLFDNDWHSPLWDAAEFEAANPKELQQLRRNCRVVSSHLCSNRYMHLQSYLSNCIGKAHADALPGQWLDVSFDHVEMSSYGIW